MRRVAVAVGSNLGNRDAAMEFAASRLSLLFENFRLSEVVVTGGPGHVVPRRQRAPGKAVPLATVLASLDRVAPEMSAAVRQELTRARRQAARYRTELRAAEAELAELRHDEEG